MNVLFLSTDKKIADPTSAVFSRMQRYASWWGNLTIYVLGTRGDRSTRGGLTVIPIRARLPWGAYRQIRKSLNENKETFDVVSAMDAFEVGLVGYFLGEFLKIPLQVQIHTDIFSREFKNESFKNRFRTLLARYVLKKAEGIRVVSERIKNSLLERGVPLKKICLLPLFTSPEERPAVLNLHKLYPQFEFIVLMISRIAPEKDIDLAIQAFGEIVPGHPEIGLVIVGEGSEKSRLVRTVYERGLDKNIVFEPWAEDTWSYYKTADVFLGTSKYEGYGLTLIEAAIALCPIITTDVGVVGDTLNKFNARVIPVGDATALRDAVLDLKNHPEYRKALIQKERELKAQLPDLEAYASMWRTQFDRLLSKH